MAPATYHNFLDKHDIRLSASENKSKLANAIERSDGVPDDWSDTRRVEKITEQLLEEIKVVHSNST